MPKAASISKWLWGVLFLGLVIKIAYLIFSQQSPFFEPALLDPAYYHQWAKKILGGDLVGDKVFYGLPAYPFFLALCYKIFGASIFAVKALQALLGLLTLFFVYKIGEKIEGQTTGTLAVFLAVLYGPLFFHESILIPEALSLPLYAAALYFSLVFVETRTLKCAAGLGILFGLAALTKAGILPFVFLFLLSLAAGERRSGRKRFFPLALCLVSFFLTLLPVTLHNRVYGKDNVLLTSHAGFNFYIGNNPKAEGVFIAPEGTGSNVEAQIQDSKAVAERALGRELKPSEVSRYWSGRAWEFIRRNPGQFLRLSLRKLVLFFDAREISDVDDYEFCKNFSPMLRWPWLNFSVLGPLVLLGLFLSLKKIRFGPIIYLWIASYLGGLVVFFINARYRLPILSAFFPLAALAILETPGLLRRRAWGKIIFGCLILLAGVKLGQAQLVGTLWDRNYVNAGDVYMEKKEYDSAERFYRQAILRNPEFAKAHEAMAVLLTKTGRYDEAKPFYEKAIGLEPDNSLAYNNLGLWYERSGDLESAERLFLKAIDLKPNSSQAHNNLGMVYAKKGENEKAVQEFKNSIALNPGNPRTYTNLGLVLHHLGQPQEARRLWKKALELNPDFEEAKRALQLS